MNFKLLTRKTCVVPTWRGWVTLLLCASLAAAVVIRGVYPFLAINDPAPGGILVAEGWLGDEDIPAVLEEFRRNHYASLFVTGGPVEKGLPLSEYKTWPELTVAALVKSGFDPKLLHAVPAEEVRRDRTYASALALKHWLQAHGMPVTSVNIVSGGPHARRTRLLFQRAFGNGVRVGILSVGGQNFDPKHWWRSSEGFRVVTGEAIAYLYARLLFRAPRE